MNLGTRDYFTYTDAMLNNSLFSYYLKRNGLNVYRRKQDSEFSKDESTRDVVCLDFDFGSRSFDDEFKRLSRLLDGELNDDARKRVENAIKKVKERENLYSEKKRGEIRDKFYNEGVDITYTTKNKDGTIKKQQTIHYEMLFRTSAKAKLGQVIFINSKLYKKAYDWLTMGLGGKMLYDNAKIVELSAYAPLTTSTIVGTIHIPVEDILILKDQDSFFEAVAEVVRAEDYVDINGQIKKKCIVSKQQTKVKNTVWDGMGLIECDPRYLRLPDFVNGMLLIREHMFKNCCVKGYLQKFFQDWCTENGYDYETHQVQDMFGVWHYLKDVKMITTNNAIKWLKFKDLMGGTPEAAYEYWCNRIRADGCVWGIVKTDHESKLGECQQLSYQMINTLPCTKDDVKAIAQTSIDYVELIKADDNEFEKFLRKNANEVNHYEMLADLYDYNHGFAESKWFREEKRKIISNYVRRLRKGKIFVEGDNLTAFGNPYALLLYAVGENWKDDPTFQKERGCIQCYTPRFSSGEYLAAFRNPHNSPNNICYLHNVYSKYYEKYFDFSNNIIAVNCIETDIQSRANGMDWDSDFVLATNQREIVKAAKFCYENYPTIVNDLKESGITYNNTKTDYANMDNKFSGSQMGIGWSSNLAQLAITYYWTEMAQDEPNSELLQQYYDNFVILSVLAQLVIDSCKRTYEIDGEDEIKRISKLPCMSITKAVETDDGKVKTVKRDFPEFMKYTREIKCTKDGKDLPHNTVIKNRYKLNQRINYDLQCPMNWLQGWLDKIQNTSSINTIPTKDFFVKMQGKANDRQMTKIRKLVELYDSYIKYYATASPKGDSAYYCMVHMSREILDKLCKIKIGNAITINRLIETALGLELNNNRSLSYKDGKRYTRKMLNLLYKMDKNRFLNNFICEN